MHNAVGARLNFFRYLSLLGIVGAALLATDGYRFTSGFRVSFAFYGALHAAVLIASLRQGGATLRRRVSFVVTAAALSYLVAEGAYVTARLLIGSPLDPRLAAALASAIGAASYGGLINGFLRLGISAGLLGAVAMACLLTTSLTAAAGLYSTWPGTLWFVLPWWVVFSGALGSCAAAVRPARTLGV